MLEHLDTWRLDDGEDVPQHLKALSRSGMERGAQAAKAALSSLALTDAVLLLAPGSLALASLRIGYDQVPGMVAMPNKQHTMRSPESDQSTTITNSKRVPTDSGYQCFR